MESLANLFDTVTARKDTHVEGSYTSYLFEQGLDKILKKVGEECSEVIIAAKNAKNGETLYEIADLVYHLMVLMAEQGISLDSLDAELAERAKKQGNLKEMKKVDKNT